MDGCEGVVMEGERRTARVAVVPCRYLPSPHCDERPAGVQPELVVLHAISLPAGVFGGPCVDDLFLGRLDTTRQAGLTGLAGLRVSAHFLIDRQGAITQYVPVLKRAWHAGASCWRGRTACNDFSVGIELEGDAHTAFEAVQYQHLAVLIRTLQLRLPRLCDEHITGHQYIAPGRKWDPGPCFDWDLLHQLLGDAALLGVEGIVWT